MSKSSKLVFLLRKAAQNILSLISHRKAKQKKNKKTERKEKEKKKQINNKQKNKKEHYQY